MTDTPTTKIQPAAPLPWTEGEYTNYISEKSSSPLKAILLTGFALSNSSVDEEALQNSEYITHTANAYPELIEGLKAIVQRADQGEMDRMQISAIRKIATNLLTRLGEAD